MFGDAPRSSRAISVDAAGPVADAHQVERLAADADLGPGVAQHGEADGAQRRRHVAVVVVIAEHGEDADGGGERGQGLCRRA